jgi:hypothetical protein
MRQIEDLDELISDRLYFIYNRAEGKEFYAGRYSGGLSHTTCVQVNKFDNYTTYSEPVSWGKSSIFFTIEFDSCQLNHNYKEFVEIDDDYEGVGYSKAFTALEFMNTLLIYEPEPEELCFLI